MSNCAICLEPFRDAVLLPACGHSFCKHCVDALPTSRRGLGGAREALCPLCRTPYAPGSAVPNFGLRDAGSAPAAIAAPPPPVPHAPLASSMPRGRAVNLPPRPERLATLGVPVAAPKNAAACAAAR